MKSPNLVRRRALTGAALVAVASGAAWLRARRRLDLHGKVVVVTGGSRGLGLALARRFADRGARLAILARDPLALESARRDLAERGHLVLVVPCDVARRAHVQDALALVREQLGPVDVLVNNAGLIQVGPLETMTMEDFETSLGVHVRGPLHLVLELLPSMRARGQGHIVNIVSIGGRIPVPHLLPYVVGKFGLAGLSEGLRVSLGGEGIHVTTVIPGLMRTGSPERAGFKGRAASEYAWFGHAASLPGITVSAERAARLIVRACEHGRGELLLGWPSKLATRIHAVAPRTFQALTSGLARLLPKAPGDLGARGGSTPIHEGRDCHAGDAPGLLMTLNEKAAHRLNQLRH